MRVVYRECWWRRYEGAVNLTVIAALGVLIVTGVLDLGPSSQIYGWVVIAAGLGRIPAVVLRARSIYVSVSDDGVHVRTARIRRSIPEAVIKSFIPWSNIREINVESVGEGHRDGFRYPTLTLPDGTSRPLRILTSALYRSHHPARIFNPREAMYDPRFDAKIATMRAYLVRHQDTPTTH